MAQVGNLIVTGSSRFLNKINGVCTDGTSGTTKYMRQDGAWVVPPNDNTDTKVTQTDTTTNANYRLLFSESSDDTTKTEGARKSHYAMFNPSKHALTIGYRMANSTEGTNSIALGQDVTASGDYSFCTGVNNKATSLYSYAEGVNTTSSGNASHTEGVSTSALGTSAHAEGYETSVSASSTGGHAEGLNSTVDGSGAHAEGQHATASSQAAHAEGGYTTASSYASHAEGNYSTASGYASHAEGDHTTANHKSQHVFGEYNIVDPSTAAVTARGNYVEIVGNGTSSTRSNARTLDWSGNEWIANSLVVGSLKSGTTIGQYATALGGSLTASGSYSHAEGSQSTASGNYSHAEGNSTTASGQYGAHSEGGSTTASGNSSHAEGFGSTASGYYSHADGYYTTASHKSQHVFGEYNALDTSTAAASARGTYVEIVGKGSSSSARSNARTLNWNGNEWIAGTLTQGSSIEIKKNVADMTQEDADKILNLRPVVFDYKSSEKDIQAERGFIAEEVKEIIPNLVTDKIVNDNGDTVAPASLNYIAMIPYLVKVCQRQQEEIDRLKSLIGK